MANQFRSKGFLKIKHSIQSATNSDHLVSISSAKLSPTGLFSAVPLPIRKGHWEDRDNDGYDDTWVDDEA